MSQHPPLPRDLDVQPLKRQILYHTTAAGVRLAYFPLSILVFVTEVAGTKAAARAAAVTEAADMLKFRATQLGIPAEQLLRHTKEGWPVPPPVGSLTPQDCEYVTHRGFIEVLAYWMNQKVVGQPVPPGIEELLPRLQRFYQYQAQIGEILFGVIMPPSAVPVLPTTATPQLPPSVNQSPTFVAPPPALIHAPITSAYVPPPPPTNVILNTPAASIAHLTPVLPNGPVAISTPPIGTQTIQDEIEEFERASLPAKSEKKDDVEMKDADAATASTSKSPTAEFIVPAEGIMVHLTRHDGRDLTALTGRLKRILPNLTLTSPMPSHRNINQPISVLKSLTKENATIEEYWNDRFFTYPRPEQKDPTSIQRIRICEVQLDDGAPYIYPADKIWRSIPSATGAIEPNPAIESVSQPSLHKRFFPDAPAPPQISTLSQLWLDVAADPWNYSAWQQLLIEVQLTHDLQAIRHAYHSFLKVFPSSSQHWKSLIELELNHQQYAEIERILPGALRSMPEVELWKMYLVYQKIIHSPPGGHGTEEQMREMNLRIEQAYEYVLEHMGLDLHAGQIWKSYINFLKAIPTRSPAEEQGKTASLRKLYQRVISIPIQPKELNQFWEEYQNFERQVAQQFQNKTLMNKMIQDWTHKFQVIQKESQERRKRYFGILSASVGQAYGQVHQVTQADIHIPNRPSLNQLQQLKDALQLSHWIKYIRFETRKVEGQDMTAFKQRSVLAYRQCLMYCRHYPNIWYDYIHFISTPKLYFPPEQIKNAWQEFKQAMPYSILPTLIHADYEEEAKHLLDAKVLYETLLQHKKADELPNEEHYFRLPASVIEDEKKLKAYEAEIAKEESNATVAAPPPFPGAPSTAVTPAPAPVATVKEEPKEPEQEGVIDIYKGELHKVHPLIFILFMRFVRRSEGVDAARKVFLLARRSPSITYHTYLYAAYAEHHINNDLQKAQAIYGFGMKTYGDQMEAYLLQYLNFLKETNDHNNLRLIFGRILLTESAESAESSQLSRKESALLKQERAVKEAKDASAAAAAVREVVLPAEAQNDASYQPDDWWAYANGLLETNIDPNDTAAKMLPPQPTPMMLSLWSSYVNFERDTANELGVVMKAEEKRDAKLHLRFSFRILHWIDRWRFLDLWCCSPALRQTIAKVTHPGISCQLLKLIEAESEKELEKAQAQPRPEFKLAPPSTSTAPRQRGVLISDPSVVANLKASVCRPDLTRLSLFSATSQQFDRASVRLRYNGQLPVPEQILNVLSVLPPAHLFQGPYVHPDLILQMLQQVPELETPTKPAAVPYSATKPSAAATQPSVAQRGGKGGAGGPYKKRKARDVEEEDEAEANAANLDMNTPSNDLYRKRQQQKLLAKQTAADSTNP